jgi:hypothetical protein
MEKVNAFTINLYLHTIHECASLNILTNLVHIFIRMLHYNIQVVNFSSLSHRGYRLKTLINKHLTMHDKHYKINGLDHGRPC